MRYLPCCLEYSSTTTILITYLNVSSGILGRQVLPLLASCLGNKVVLVIQTQNARDVIKKAEKDLLRERIRLINNKLGRLQDRKVELVREINKQLPSNVSKHCVLALDESSREREFEISKWRQVNKLKRLITTRVSDRNNIDLSGTQLKIQANRQQNQGPRQRTKLRGYTRQADGGGIHHRYGLLPHTKSEQLRYQVAGIMTTAKLPKPNIKINRKERQALAERKQKVQ